MTQAFREEIVRRHVEGGESYRAIARWIERQHGRKPSAIRLQHIIEDVARRCKTAWEMSQELHPRWNGYILLDEKKCSVKGKLQWFYLAMDTTGDILHCRSVVELSSNQATDFLKEVLSLPIRVRGVITDLDSALTRAVETLCANKPYQYCIKHALAALAILIRYAETRVRNNFHATAAAVADESRAGETGQGAKLSPGLPGAMLATNPPIQRHIDLIGALYRHCQLVLVAATEHEALQRFDQLRRNRTYPRTEHRKAVRFIKRRWARLMCHHRVPEMPRTTNLIENVNKQLQRRYKTIESFQYSSTAIHYTNLLIAYLRQKPYTDCRGSRKSLNGKSRLVAAHVKRLNPDWIRNCLKPD